MIITFTIILSSLVALNFLLLIFSCNRTTKRSTSDSQIVIAPNRARIEKPTKKLTAATHLAPTGS